MLRCILQVHSDYDFCQELCLIHAFLGLSPAIVLNRLFELEAIDRLCHH